VGARFKLIRERSSVGADSCRHRADLLLPNNTRLQLRTAPQKFAEKYIWLIAFCADRHSINVV
jgi:hypothetical protein